MIGSHESLKERVVLKVIFMWRDIDVQSVKTIHRFLPECVHPYKQYDAEIIDGVIEGLIDSDTLGFEDYPCEMTMKRWRSHNLTPKI